MGVKIGEEVGYTIRFEDQTNPVRTFMTFLFEVSGYEASFYLEHWISPNKFWLWICVFGVECNCDKISH